MMISAQLKIPPFKLIAMNYFESWGPREVFLDTSIAIKLTPWYTYLQRFSQLNLITLSIRLPVSYSNNLSIYVSFVVYRHIDGAITWLTNRGVDDSDLLPIFSTSQHGRAVQQAIQLSRLIRCLSLSHPRLRYPVILGKPNSKWDFEPYLPDRSSWTWSDNAIRPLGDMVNRVKHLPSRHVFKQGRWS